jgi:uncharacterized membrane protein YfcA
MDFTLYWFMLPVSIGVATCAMLSGIGGAALFTPIFVLLFPLLGPEYVLASTFAAISTALLTQTFGFLSGFIGYYRRRMIDFELAIRFIKISVPIAVVGALVAHAVHDGILIAAYAVLVFILAIGMLFLRRRQPASRPNYDAPYRKPEIPKSDFFLAGVGALHPLPSCSSLSCLQPRRWSHSWFETAASAPCPGTSLFMRSPAS